jgi:hypothetical protein
MKAAVGTTKEPRRRGSRRLSRSPLGEATRRRRRHRGDLHHRGAFPSPAGLQPGHEIGGLSTRQA